MRATELTALAFPLFIHVPPALFRLTGSDEGPYGWAEAHLAEKNGTYCWTGSSAADHDGLPRLGLYLRFLLFHMPFFWGSVSWSIRGELQAIAAYTTFWVSEDALVHSEPSLRLEKFTRGKPLVAQTLGAKRPCRLLGLGSIVGVLLWLANRLTALPNGNVKWEELAADDTDDADWGYSGWFCAPNRVIRVIAAILSLSKPVSVSACGHRGKLTARWWVAHVPPFNATTT
jgi:hypothetical protein